MKKIADVCINDIPKLIGADLASLYILDDNSDILHLEKNNHPFLINNIVSLNQTPPSPMVASVRSKNIIITCDVGSVNPNCKNADLSFSQNYNTKGCIISPLICQNRVVGVLNLSDKSDGTAFTQSDVTAIELFRQLIGASIGNVKLFEKSQRLAQTDGLTGMYNHRTFYETLEAELRRAQRYNSQISIIMADIDNLKPINDKFGHRAGDMAIKQISRKLSACIRKIDIASRYGGDEFAIILPNTSIDDAKIVAERMVETVKATPMIWEHNEVKLSISIGVGQYNSDSQPGDVTKATDHAMYAAKQAGKGQVRVFQTSEPV